MSTIKPRNAADPSQVSAQEQSAKRRRERELSDLRAILELKEGRRFLYRLVNTLCHYDADCFDHSGSVTSKRLGERNIGRLVKSDALEASHDLYQLAERENWPYLKGEDNE